ncbi:hypothetical protein DICPUDRAFT_75065 [Dictyostelium purpureum]|uniref:DUF4922 domain-containing protein n=1 Tax=Dictyostelium purpureum TaxID=5786 RepID=F0Z9J2_DICPU|nr:uncharacterized protein DICPUDRAFT_75065 [Dictyostelium purpureum]EGC39393.1 hypothetical protein DICPUDRAFT_75065 [Dictyostelium purpureum]|eukprot:XP_003284067.1 hypothetical protein DICPUDRAFT_75065 [Dictyostelium purpureum]
MIEDLNKILKQEEIQKDVEDIIKNNLNDKIKGWKESMNYLYNFSVKTGYIQEERLKLNVILPKHYQHSYGGDVGFEVTINCSKPEIIVGKDIVGAAHYSNFYGECVICFDNVGSDKREGLRAYEFTLSNGVTLFRQYPPYPYFKHHNIIIDRKHTPQVLSRSTILELLEMSESMPGYKIASNTDRVGTGATNLHHRHYQAGDHPFTVFSAKPIKQFKCNFRNQETNSNEVIIVEWLHYPCCCLKVIGSSKKSVEQVSYQLFSTWRNHDFPTLKQELQTCSLISTLDVESNQYQFLIFPRNAEQPRFLTSQTLQCIKKEFVGIFELCGYAILPGRLKDQLQQLESLLANVTLSNHNEKLILPQELMEFKQWLIEYYFSITDNNLSISDKLHLSLQNSFITILSDNSPIKLNNSNLIDIWINNSNLNLIN